MAIDLQKLQLKFDALFNDPNFVTDFEQWLEARNVRQNSGKPFVSGSLLSPPKEIWVNIYNSIKPNSWDIHTNEKSAVINSIGAPTHCYKHESIIDEIQRRQLMIKSEPDGIVRETMINNLLLDI